MIASNRAALVRNHAVATELRAHQTHPALLLEQRHGSRTENGPIVEGSERFGGPGCGHREPVQRHVVHDRGPRFVLVGPVDVTAGATGHHLDVVTASCEMFGEGAAGGLGSSDDLRSVPLDGVEQFHGASPADVSRSRNELAAASRRSCVTRSKPRRINSDLSASSQWTAAMASANIAGPDSKGSTSAPRATVSDVAPASRTIAGTPNAIDSSGGMPKPSCMLALANIRALR